MLIEEYKSCEENVLRLFNAELSPQLCRIFILFKDPYDFIEDFKHFLLPKVYFANSWPISLNALNSKAFPAGSLKNIVACSPTSPSNRM